MSDKIEITVIKDDKLAGFGAYAKGKNIILFNVVAHLIASIEEEIPIKEIMLETLMHEFGHCMEEKLGLEFSEDRIHKIIESYQEKYGKEQIIQSMK